MDGCDVAYHLAGDYRVGIRATMRAAMEPPSHRHRAVIDAAVAAGLGRIVHVSTINAYGDTGYRVVDETY
jgi:nucleoside-diphosphate-sugar epimerase